MKSLLEITKFGGIDADNDTILLDSFEDHEAFKAVIAREKFLIVGRKGSGKTAIFKKLLTTKSPDFLCFGHTFTDYPWHFHERQARIGIPEADRYTHSWQYLILLTFSKVILNQDQSIPFDDISMDRVLKIEKFVVDSYGTRDPDISQLFTPTKILHIKPSFEVDIKFLKAGLSAERLPITELPTIVQEVNAGLLDAVTSCLNPSNKYFICFDQLDLGFDPANSEYSSRLIGLLLACRQFNLAAQNAGVQAFVVVFLRDDIYNELHFEDKNKITQNFKSTIEWDTDSTSNTLKSLMERRFTTLLADGESDKVTWNMVFNEAKEMPGRQDKYDHILDRTFFRPRDIIQFCNVVLKHCQSRLKGDGLSTGTFENEDIHGARNDYGSYFLEELDDELHKHLPQYQDYFEVFKAIGTLQFTKDEFEAQYALRKQAAWPPIGQVVLKEFYTFSVIGFYRAGGRGFGGSSYVFRYRDSRAQFDETATRFRVHPGLMEVLALKKYSKASETE